VDTVVDMVVVMVVVVVELPMAAALVFSPGTHFVIMPIRPLRGKAMPTVNINPRVVLMRSPASTGALMCKY
jgi:hypothetical protein